MYCTMFINDGHEDTFAA